MEPILKINNLSHKYGRTWAIHDINLEINQTGILGLLGSNGAGKSTTMNIMCGVLNQTEGSVLINGLDMRKSPESAKMHIGFLPQNAPLYMDLTVDEYLIHCAGLRLMKTDSIKTSLDEVKARCGISHFSHRLISNLSGGYRQRVGIAQAIIHKPQLVVLDEPTNGLDPNQIIEVRKLIKEIAVERAVIFSSHILSEVQLLCKDIVMIEDGKIVFANSINAFNNYIEPHSLLVNFNNPPNAAEIMGVADVTKVDFLTSNLARIYFDSNQNITEKIVEKSVQQGWRLTEINLDKTSIDEIFAQLSNKSTTIS